MWFSDVSPESPGLRHLSDHFLFGDAADTAIILLHADISDIIELTKDAQLTELGNPRKKYKFQIRITSFERTEEVPHFQTKLGKILILMNHIQ